MQAILIRPCSSGFGQYEIPPDARVERVSRKGATRREDLDGLVQHGGPGHDDPVGRVWEYKADPFEGTYLVVQQ